MRLSRRRGPDYRACARGRLLRLFVWSSCLAAVLTLRPFVAAEDARPGFGEDDPRIKTSAPIFFDTVETIRVTPSGGVSDVGVRAASGTECQFEETYSDADFEGPGDFSMLFGIAELEIAATSYTIDAAFFPIQIEAVEMVFAQTGVEDTTTVLRLFIWDGTPESGTQLLDPPIDVTLNLQSPENAVNLVIDLSAAPIQVLNLSNTNTFSVGFQILEHHNQTENPCITNPPQNSNAFPAVDTSGVADGANNWFWLLNCGPLGCPAGWNRFEDLVFCEPDGDWVLRATWAPQDCDFSIGACCFGDGNCEPDLVDFVCTGQGGRFLGEGSVCPVFPEICDGACCFPDGQCAPLTSDACEGLEGEYQADGSDCDSDLCPAPIGACCVELGDIFCFEITDDECDLAGGTWKGAATECIDADQNDIADICETLVGACCMPSGSCEDEMTEEDCLSQGGSYEGDDSLCANSTCDGACCLDETTICLDDTEAADCPFEWHGPQTSCNDDINPCLDDPADGACCPAGGGPCQVLPGESCEAAGDTWFGPGSICTPGQCDEPPDPVGACCSVGGQPCSCLEGLTELACAGAPGDWAGPNSSCADCEPCEACCDPCTQVCVDELPSVCVNFGNLPQGESSNCTNTACPVPSGACCGPEPDVCVDRTESNCNLLGGIWQGCEILCDQADCAAIGACCLPNESCVQLQIHACEDNQGGEYLGDGTICVPGLCEQAECKINSDCEDGSACTDDSCNPDNLCVHVPVDCSDGDLCTTDDCNPQTGDCLHEPISCDDGDACTDDICIPASGCAHTPIVRCCGNGEVEEGEECEPPGSETCDDDCLFIPTGACCQGKDCVDGLTANQCAADGGTYRGDDTTCKQDPCATGACCLTDFEECLEGQTPESCPAAIGIFQGDGSTCADADCGPVVETEACCTSDESCFDWPVNLCNLLAFEPQGPGSTCASTECADPTGACCAGDGSCSVVTEADCGVGSYLGDGTDCETGVCCQADPDCDDGGLCNGAETCLDNVCQDGPPPGDGTECSDGEACTESDICTAGVCGGTAVNCAGAGGQCNTASCDPAGTEGNCDILTPEPDDTPCDDQNACTENDICTAGVCGGMALECGACCFSNGNCQDGMSANDCAGAGGTHQGVGSTCAPGSCIPAVGNDLCADAIPTFAGLTDFDTTGAKTDGPAHPDDCEFDGQTYHDIWYTYTADCTADTVVTTCEDLGADADYDTDLVVYDGCDCAKLVLLGCNDDDDDNPCGTNPNGPFHSTVTVPMVAGNCYFIRVGGWNPGDSGTGTLLIDPQCGACCQGDTCVDDQGPGECTDAGGVFQGIDSACADSGGEIDCSITGACCTAGGGCAEMTAQACAEQSGAYEGDGTFCDPDPCECGDCPWDVGPPGPNDQVGPEDLAFLLGNWGPIPQDADPEVQCLDIGPPGPNGQIGPEDLALVLGNWGLCP